MAGLLFGGLPLVAARLTGAGIDPFDLGASYLVWLGGSFASALGLAYARPDHHWTSTLAVVTGLVASMVVEITIDAFAGGPAHTLWPLTLALTVAIGTPPAVAGAHLGARLGSQK